MFIIGSSSCPWTVQGVGYADENWRLLPNCQRSGPWLWCRGCFVRREGSPDIIPGQPRQHNTPHLAPREFPVVKVNTENGNINEMIQDQTLRWHVMLRPPLLSCSLLCDCWLLIVSAVSLINQGSLRISALPHTSRCVMIVPHLSPFSVTFLTRVCDAAWQSRDDWSQDVTFPDCGENVQWTPAGNITAINKSCHELSGHVGIFTFSRQEVRAVGDTQTRGVLLITPCRSHGHLDSSHSILTNQRPGQWASGQWEDRVQNNWGWFISRCHHSDAGVRSQCSKQHETQQTSGNGQTQDTRWSSPWLMMARAGDSHRYLTPGWSLVRCPLLNKTFGSE